MIVRLGSISLTAARHLFTIVFHISGSSATGSFINYFANLGLPEISEYIRIEDVSSKEEIELARSVRRSEGKHVIPVPTFEIKKDFSGYLLDPLQIFKSKGRGNAPYISEKSIIRPTFSYMGNFKISDTVFKQIVEYLSEKANKIINNTIEYYKDSLKQAEIELEDIVPILKNYLLERIQYDFYYVGKKTIQDSVEKFTKTK